MPGAAGGAGRAEHVPVLLQEVLELLQPEAGQVFVDATIGLGGHAVELAKRVGPEGRVAGVDRDPMALAVARERLAAVSATVQLFQSRFVDAWLALQAAGFVGVDGVLFDLGVSSLQLDNPERGFSFQQSGPLDMRMSAGSGHTAAHLVNSLEEEKLANLFFEFGEERHSRRIARRLVEARQRRRIETTRELADLVARSVPHSKKEKIHPATRVFQALRIAVNEELAQIAPSLRSAVDLLRPGGRVAVISFHSLEDRIVKTTFARFAGACTCPPGLPVCGCGARAEVRLVTRKAVQASPAEVEVNPRSRSARLRVVEKLAIQPA